MTSQYLDSKRRVATEGGGSGSKAGGDKKSNNATNGSVGKASPSKSNSPDGAARRPAGNSKGEPPMLREWNSSYHRHEYIAVKYPTVSRPVSSTTKPETSESGKKPSRQS